MLDGEVPDAFENANINTDAVDAKAGPDNGERMKVIWPEAQRRARPKPRWIVPDLLRRGSVSVLSGLPGTFKSFLALDLALCIANEINTFLGREVKEAGSVLIIAADDGEETVIDRLRKIAKFRLGQTNYESIAIVGRGEFHFQKDGAQRRLEQAIDECAVVLNETPVLIIFDTAVACGAPAADFGHDYGEVMRWLKEVAQAWDCAFLLLDHEAQPSPDRARRDIRSRAWGSTMKAGFFEAAWSLHRIVGGKLALEVSDKRSPTRPAFELAFGSDPNTYAMSFCEATPAQANNVKVLAAMKSAKTPSSVTALTVTTRLPRSSVQRAIQELTAAGDVKVAQEPKGSKAGLYAAAGQE